MTVSIFTAKPKLPKNPLCDMVIITGSRYLVAGNTLLIRDVSPSDAGAYSCLARHAVTGATRRARPALLAVTGECALHCEPRAAGSLTDVTVCAAGGASSAPRLLATGGELSVQAGHPVCLPCVASDHPPPQYT